ncbi:MAG: hypothetical protein FD146_372 [Anaerolineaceae bacterium]|nr:MAG: hypothetical protein FD146_372 [Anaerolineaceae bacterium]
MKPNVIWKGLLFTIPAGLILAALLSLTQPGSWVLGWLAFSALLAPGLFLLIILWRWAGAGRTLFWLTLAALVLRIGAGAALEQVLPAAGSGSETQAAGYAFYDAYHRDTQAWALASSGQPLWLAFSKSYSMDQYGGLLGLSAAAYRGLSPDAHRPLLVIVLAALFAAAGIPLAWKASRLAWGEGMAAPVALILAVYPESVLQGSAQMREPFLITFVVMSFLGAAEWRSAPRRAWAWLAAGFAGMLLFSPGVAIFTLVILAGWLWLRGRFDFPYGDNVAQRGRRIPWRAVLTGAGVLALALVLLWAGLARGNLAGRPPLEVLTSWLRFSSQWDIHLLEKNSGWVQKLFEEMPAWLQLPFVILYGLARPVLPAAIVDSTWWPWKIIEILRAAGWYALAPFLVYSLVAIFRSPKQRRLAWLWLWMASWAWSILSAIRAGADDWDNPRYRVMFLLLQAALAAFAWTRSRSERDPWLGRILLVEGIFLAFFTEWYLSRYTGAFGKLPFGVMVACILALGGLVILGGWWRDRQKASRESKPKMKRSKL